MEEGGGHTRILKDGVLITTVPGHAEIKEMTARKILKDAGQK